MKRKLIINILAFLILLCIGQTVVNAADEEVKFTPSKENVKPGEEFTVMVSANSDNGLSGLSATVDYSQSILEVVNTQLVDTTNWADFDTFPNIVVLWKTALSDSKSANIYKITFKVKDGIENTSTDIILKNIIFSPATGNEVKKSDITQNIKITSASNSENNDDKTTETQGDSSNVNQQPASQQPAPQQPTSQSSSSVEDSSKQTSSQTQVAATSSQKAASTTDNTNENLANKNLPYSGKITNILLVIVGIISILGIVSYKIYSKYRGI